MVLRFKYVLMALGLAGCATAPSVPEFSNVPNSLRSEFAVSDTDQSMYGPFVAATLAQHDSAFADAAEYYMRALEVDPDSRFVADRAFFQLLYAGRMEEAGKVAVTLAQSEAGVENDDLVSILYVLEAYKRRDWPTVRQRLDGSKMAGFGGLVSPIIRAWSFVAEGDIERARLALFPMLEDQRLKPIADEHLAYMFDHLQDFESAEAEYLQLADATQPASLQPFVAYADMLARNGKRDEARSFMGKVAAQYNNNRFLLREGMLIAAGRPPSQRTANPDGALGSMFFRLASEFSQGSSPQAAVVYLRMASYLTPEVADIYFMLGNLMDQLDNPRAAATVYDTVPASSILHRAAQERKINALRRIGQIQQAEDSLRNALRDNPEDANYLTSLGDLLRGKEDFDEAILRYSTAIDIMKAAGKEEWFVYFARGVSYEQAGDWEKAEYDLTRALSLSPNEPSVLNYLGYSWIDRGLYIEKAKGYIEKAVEERPNDGFIIDSLGWVNYLTGDYEEAVKLLEQAVRIEPTDVTINHHLGDAYWQVGREIEARFQWQHAIDSNPKADELAQLQRKLDLGLPKES
ncbi:tetratricopeptide repeat protein [Kordiimonas aquimaris]|uniref:tetratricopeptide repeat protein n=1 Tax=Kordiimonas aquimaris TaxID=707591 RepID=UPI0021D3DF8A|nr:tetratricopeptide repeat protein [Kordiimonas aquimaris]